MTTIKAATYRRSSKDRHDVSLQDQKQHLAELAKHRGMAIVAEYSDVVESGKDEDRPGYQELVKAVRTRDRGWTHLLVNDTARLARRRLIGLIFEEHECRRHGVTLIYRSVPESDDPATTMMLRSMLQAFDEHHSLVSRQKGMGGMAENIRKGYRAGGRAPLGYRLKHNGQGIIREGKEITKSTLEIADDAAGIKRYLELRAAGTPRPLALAQSSLKLASTTCVGVEWNALTYAGHTVWGMQREVAPGGGYGGESKRKPRSEWQITRNTHAALITDAQAETILRRLETSTLGKAVSAARRGMSPLLLSGLLVAPDGHLWESGGGGRYRYRVEGKPGRYVRASDIEQAVLQGIAQDVQAEDFVQALVGHAGVRKVDDDGTRRKLQQKLIHQNIEIDRTVALAAQMDDPAPVLRRIAVLERERAQTQAQQAEVDQELAERQMMSSITADQVRITLQDFAERLTMRDAAKIKATLADLLTQVELDPESLTLRLNYRLPSQKRIGGAFPRRDASYPLSMMRAHGPLARVR